MEYVYTTSAGNLAYRRVTSEDLLCLHANGYTTADANIILHLKRVPNTTLTNVFNGISTKATSAANFDYTYAIAQVDTLQDEILPSQFLATTSTADPNITTTTIDFEYPDDNYLYYYTLDGDNYLGAMTPAQQFYPSENEIKSLCKLDLTKESSYVYIWLPNNSANNTVSAMSAGINLMLSGLSSLNYDIIYAKAPNYWSAFNDYKTFNVDCRFTNIGEIRNVDFPETVPISINGDIITHYGGIFYNTYTPVSCYNCNCTLDIREWDRVATIAMISACNMRIDPNVNTVTSLQPSSMQPTMYCGGYIHSAVDSTLSGYMRIIASDTTSGYLKNCTIRNDITEDPEWSTDTVQISGSIVDNCDISSTTTIHSNYTICTNNTLLANDAITINTSTATNVSAKANSVNFNTDIISAVTASATSEINVHHNNNTACSAVSSLSAVCSAFMTPTSPAFCLELQNCYVSAGQLYNYYKAFQNRDPYGVMYYYAGAEDKVLTLSNTDFNIEHLRGLAPAREEFSATWLRAEDSNITCPASALYGISAKRCYINGTYYEEKIPS